MSHYKDAVFIALAEEDLSMSKWAQRAGIPYGKLHLYLTRETKPDVKILRALCDPKNWESPACAEIIFEGFMQDCANSAGYDLTEFKYNTFQKT